MLAELKEKFLVIITDLDGTLLDQQTYSYEPSLAAVTRLRAREIPLVLCSSKTAAEIITLHREIGLRDPFICESGGANATALRQLEIGSGGGLGAIDRSLRDQLFRHQGPSRNQPPFLHRIRPFGDPKTAQPPEMDVLFMDVTGPVNSPPPAGRCRWMNIFAPQKEFLSAPIEANRYRGRIYGVPPFVDAGMLYFRKDLLAKYRLTPPCT